jgi:glycopeptide antibiotics resistance protein
MAATLDAAGTLGSMRTAARLAWIALGGFLLVLFALTLTNHPFSQEIHTAVRPFIPRAAQERLTFDVVLNALLLAPLGFLLPILSKRRIRFLATIGIAAAVSGFIELARLLVFTEREPQWRDFVLNVLSAAAGYVVATAVQRTSMRRRKKTVSPTAAAASTSGTPTANGTDADNGGGSYPATSASSDRA